MPGNLQELQQELARLFVDEQARSDAVGRCDSGLPDAREVEFFARSLVNKRRKEVLGLLPALAAELGPEAAPLLVAYARHRRVPLRDPYKEALAFCVYLTAFFHEKDFFRADLARYSAKKLRMRFSRKRFGAHWHRFPFGAIRGVRPGLWVTIWYRANGRIAQKQLKLC